MKFTLTFEGDLPASGNKPKPDAIWKVRNAIHPQLCELFATHPTLVEMTHSNFVDSAFPRVMWRDLAFIPVVRSDRKTVCSLDITFLRSGDAPGKVYQGGDLDNRIKTLFDALRMPVPGDAVLPPEPPQQPMRTLLQNDDLITGFRIRSDRLLTPVSGGKHWVKLIIVVHMTASSVTLDNASFLGD